MTNQIEWVALYMERWVMPRTPVVEGVRTNRSKWGALKEDLERTHEYSLMPLKGPWDDL